MEGNVSRTNHDMAQANLMRGLRPRSNDTSANKATGTSRRSQIAQVNENDLRLGLEGLERASQHEARGKLTSALKLYELSIELLLKYLKQLPRDDADRVRRENYKQTEQIVQQALNDAETLKAKLQRLPSRANNPNSPDSIESSTSFRSLSQALVSALGRATSTSATTRTNGLKVHDKPPVVATVPRPAIKDELYETILDEFYIDASRVQSTKWSDIAGLQACQQALQEAAVLPLLRPDLCTGLRRPQNVLLYGPPGTGKTLLVRAVSQESQSNLFVCTSSALTSKWMGEAEKLVRKLFAVARDMVPSILFLDEIDALLGSRKSDNEHEASRRLKTEFMVQVDGITKPNDDDTNRGGHLLLVACTNCPWDVDSAVMRRFPRRIFVPLPDEEARRVLLANLLQKTGRHGLTTRQISTLVRQTQGFTCADITAIASEASFGPLRALGGMQAIQNVKASDLRPVQMQDFESVLSNGATKSVTDAQLQRYDDWQNQQQSASH